MRGHSGDPAPLPRAGPDELRYARGRGRPRCGTLLVRVRVLG